MENKVTKENIRQKLEKTLSDVIYIKNEITGDTKLDEELGMDYFDRCNFIFRFSEKYGIKIPYEEMEKFNSIKEIEKYIKENHS